MQKVLSTVKKAITSITQDIKDLFPSEGLYKKREFEDSFDAIQFFDKKHKNNCTYINWNNPFNGTPYSVEWCSFKKLCK